MVLQSIDFLAIFNQAFYLLYISVHNDSGWSLYVLCDWKCTVRRFRIYHVGRSQLIATIVHGETSSLASAYPVSLFFHSEALVCFMTGANDRKIHAITLLGFINVGWASRWCVEL